MAFIVAKTRQGEFGHFHLLDKTERRLALPLLQGGLAFSALLYALTDPPAFLIAQRPDRRRRTPIPG